MSALIDVVDYWHLLALDPIGMGDVKAFLLRLGDLSRFRGPLDHRIPLLRTWVSNRMGIVQSTSGLAISRNVARLSGPDSFVVHIGKAGGGKDPVTSIGWAHCRHGTLFCGHVPDTAGGAKTVVAAINDELQHMLAGEMTQAADKMIQILSSWVASGEEGKTGQDPRPKEGSGSGAGGGTQEALGASLGGDVRATKSPEWASPGGVVREIKVTLTSEMVDAYNSAVQEALAHDEPQELPMTTVSCTLVDLVPNGHDIDWNHFTFMLHQVVDHGLLFPGYEIRANSKRMAPVEPEGTATEGVKGLTPRVSLNRTVVTIAHIPFIVPAPVSTPMEVWSAENIDQLAKIRLEKGGAAHRSVYTSLKAELCVTRLLRVRPGRVLVRDVALADGDDEKCVLIEVWGPCELGDMEDHRRRTEPVQMTMSPVPNNMEDFKFNAIRTLKVHGMHTYDTMVRMPIAIGETPLSTVEIIERFCKPHSDKKRTGETASGPAGIVSFRRFEIDVHSCYVQCMVSGRVLGQSISEAGGKGVDSAAREALDYAHRNLMAILDEVATLEEPRWK